MSSISEHHNVLPLIHLQDGVPRHPDHRMAHPVTLDILPGQQVAIVGPNGSGKTRLVEILTGRWPLLGANEVTYHFEGSEHLRPSENIKVIQFRDSYGSTDATYYLQQRWNQHDIDESTPLVDGRPIISLSSGELRRYQLRQALASHPRLLVIDNPFIGLDDMARRQLTEALDTLIHEEHLHVILVVSRMKDVPSFVNRIINVRDLKIVEDGLTCCPVAHRDFSPTPSSSTSPSPPILCFRDVTIRYSNRTILSHLHWTVHRGEHWALSGANGSGKSTLLSLVCADNPQAYACNIELFGRQRGTGESIWDIKRHIGYVSPEMHRAYQRDLPTIDIVASGLHDSVGLYVRPRPEQRETCLAWMQRFGIGHLADRPFLHISSGEQRLCLLARAFVKSPDLLILDEPFHGLDDENRLRATHIIEDYVRDPAVTLIIVSHYADELPACITHQLCLS